MQSLRPTSSSFIEVKFQMEANMDDVEPDVNKKVGLKFAYLLLSFCILNKTPN